MTDTTIIVRRYGVTDLPDFAPDIEAESRRANALWNKLVEIDRESAAAYAAATADDPEIAELTRTLDILLDQQKEARQDRKSQRRERRSRQVNAATNDTLTRISRSIREIRDQLKENQRRARAAAKPRLDAIEAERRARVKAARQQSGVYWGTATAIVDSYETGRSAVIRKRAQGLPAELKFRRYDGETRIVNQIVGGYDLEKFLGAGPQVSLDPSGGRRATLSMTAYSVQSGEPRSFDRMRNGKIETVTTRGPGDARKMRATINMHREIPDIEWLAVKSVSLNIAPNPDYHRLMPKYDRWLYRESRAIITATAPTDNIEPPAPGREAVAINFGWRLVPEGIRVATMVWAEKRDVEYVIVPTSMIALHERARERRSARDQILDKIMPIVKAIPWAECPVPAVADFGAALAKAPKFGARSLARLVVEWTIEAPQWRPDDWARLEEWRHQNNKLRSDEDAARRRFDGQRRDMFRVAAKKIAARASVVLIEEADFAKLARLPLDTDPALEQITRRNRQIVAPGDLRAEVLRAAKAMRRSIPEPDPGPSTWICHHGMHKVEPGAPDELRYFCGRCNVYWDQDINNCLVRLRRHEDSSGPVTTGDQRSIAAE
jgi:hypothetical protein